MCVIGFLLPFSHGVVGVAWCTDVGVDRAYIDDRLQVFVVGAKLSHDLSRFGERQTWECARGEGKEAVMERG